MKVDRVKRLCVVLAIPLAILGTQARAGGQCSKGGLCSSGTLDPKAQAEQERKKSKMESDTARRALISSSKQRGEITEADEKKSDQIYNKHKKVVENWVTVHHPELKKGTYEFDYRVLHAMGEDQDLP